MEAASVCCLELGEAPLLCSLAPGLDGKGILQRALCEGPLERPSLLGPLRMVSRPSYSLHAQLSLSLTAADYRAQPRDSRRGLGCRRLSYESEEALIAARS